MVEMGQIKVFVQELGLKQGFLADTNMDYLTSEWPGTPNFKVDANFDMFPQNYGLWDMGTSGTFEIVRTPASYIISRSGHGK